MQVQLADDWHEDYGTVLWLHFESFEEPFEVLFDDALSADFDHEYWTHFVRIDANLIIEQAMALVK